MAADRRRSLPGMNLVRAVLSDGGDTDTGTPAPFVLTESGRLDVDPAAWAQPLPLSLWERLPKSDREAHERLVRGHADAAARARRLADKARAVADADEQALRAALSDGKAPPKPKREEAAQAAARAAHEAKVAAELLVEHGRGLAPLLDDNTAAETVRDEQQAARAHIAEASAHADACRESLRKAGECGGVARWVATLIERRRQLVWRPVSAPYSPRVAQANQLAQETRVYLDAELGEQQHRDAPPPEHHAPAGAPPSGTWVSSPVDPTA